MGKIYDYFPSNVSTKPYLTSIGQTKKRDIVTYLEAAIADMEAAVKALGDVKGLGAELYTTRLNKEIQKLKGVLSAVELLS